MHATRRSVSRSRTTCATTIESDATKSDDGDVVSEQLKNLKSRESKRHVDCWNKCCFFVKNKIFFLRNAYLRCDAIVRSVMRSSSSRLKILYFEQQTEIEREREKYKYKQNRESKNENNCCLHNIKNFTMLCFAHRLWQRISSKKSITPTACTLTFYIHTYICTKSILCIAQRNEINFS